MLRGVPRNEEALGSADDCPNCERWAEAHQQTVETLRAVVAPEGRGQPLFLLVALSALSGAVAAFPLLLFLTRFKR